MKLFIFIALSILSVQAASESRLANGTNVPIDSTAIWTCNLQIQMEHGFTRSDSGAYIGSKYVLTTASNTVK